MLRFRFFACSILGLMIGGAAMPALAQDQGQTEQEFPGASHFLRGAYQWGSVLQTNDFLKGQNNAGQPIDHFHSARLEFGWRHE